MGGYFNGSEPARWEANSTAVSQQGGRLIQQQHAMACAEDFRDDNSPGLYITHVDERFMSLCPTANFHGNTHRKPP